MALTKTAYLDGKLIMDRPFSGEVRAVLCGHGSIPDPRIPAETLFGRPCRPWWVRAWGWFRSVFRRLVAHARSL
jgi:hypothetical protein